MTSDTLSLIAIVVSFFSFLSSFGVFLVEYFRFRREGAMIRVSVAPHMISLPRDPKFPLGLVLVNVVNRGKLATTITHLAFSLRPGFFDRIFLRKKEQNFLVPSPGHHPSMNPPYVLEPGHQWSGLATRDEKLVKMIETGNLFAEIWTTDTRKPYRVRISAKPPINMGSEKGS